MTDQENKPGQESNIIGFHKPGAEQRIRQASEAGLNAMLPLLLDKRDRLNEYEIEGAFCAMIRAHFEYMATQEGSGQARELYEQFEKTLGQTLRALFESATEPPA